MTKLCLILCALLYCLLIVLALRPGFDLDAAHAFTVGTDHFVGATRLGTVVRYAAWALPFVVFLVMVVAAILVRAGVLAKRLAPSGRSLLFLALSLAIAPGLLVHATLKEVSHRPRPSSITQFGGSQTFRPFYRFDGACRHNCAFPSGETAAAAWMLAPASLVPPPWRGPALAASVAFAAAAALLRMAFGAHFLSDVAAGALITILTVFVLRMALVRRTPAAAAEAPRETNGKPRDAAS